MPKNKIKLEVLINSSTTENEILEKIESIPELVKASIECSIANVLLGKPNGKIDEIDFSILSNREERDLYLNKLKIISDGLKILKFITKHSEYYSNGIDFDLDKFKTEGFDESIFQKTFFYYGVDREVFINNFPQLSAIDSNDDEYFDIYKHFEEKDNIIFPEIPEYYSVNEVGDIIFKFALDVLKSEFVSSENLTNLYLSFLYKMETTFLISFCDLKLNQIDKDYSDEEKNKILVQILKKFNTIFLNDINELSNLQQKSYQMELITSIFFDELKESGMGLKQLENIGMEVDENNSDDENEEENKLVLKQLMKLYSESYPLDIDFLDEIKKKILEGMKSKKIITYFIKLNGKYITSFYTEDRGDHIYIGGLNINKDFSYFNIGFWYAEEKVNELGVKNDLECTITKIIEGKENKSYKVLLRKYKSLGFVEYGTGETKNSEYIKLRRIKDNKGVKVS